MLFNTSYNDNDLKLKIDGLVGKSYSLFESIKQGGTGSPKFVITRASHDIETLLSLDHNLNVCNIERRPEGIIIGFRSLLESYSLVIPYYKLVVYKPAKHYTFHVDQHYISLDMAVNTDKKLKFINRILEEKNKLDENNKN